MNPLSHARVERRQPWVYAMMVAATANLLGNTVGLVADYAVVRYFLPQATWDWNTVYRSKLAWVAYWLPLLMACTVFLSLCFGEKRNPPKWSAFLIVGLEVAALGHYSLSSGISWSDLLGNLIVNPLVNHHGTYCLMPRLLLMDVFWISLVLFFPALLVEVRTALIRETGDYPDAQQMRVLGYGVRSILLGLLLCMAITAVLAKASLALLLGIAVAVFLGLGAILVMVLCQLWGIHASGRESLLITFLSGLGTAMAGAWIFLFLGENLALMISKACRGDLAAAVQVLSTQPDPVLLGLGLLIAVSLGTSVTLSSALVLRRRPERCVNLGAFVSSLGLAGLFVYWASFHR